MLYSYENEDSCDNFSKMCFLIHSRVLGKHSIHTIVIPIDAETDEIICQELLCVGKDGCPSYTPARGSPCGNPDANKVK
jgi:hypothetical protein